MSNAHTAGRVCVYSPTASGISLPPQLGAGLVPRMYLCSWGTALAQQGIPQDKGECQHWRCCHGGGNHGHQQCQEKADKHQLCCTTAKAPPAPSIKVPVTAQSSFPGSTGTVGASTSCCALGGCGLGGFLQHYHHGSDLSIMRLTGLSWCADGSACSPALLLPDCGDGQGGCGCTVRPHSPVQQKQQHSMEHVMKD